MPPASMDPHRLVIEQKPHESRRKAPKHPKTLTSMTHDVLFLHVFWFVDYSSVHLALRTVPQPDCKEIEVDHQLLMSVHFYSVLYQEVCLCLLPNSLGLRSHDQTMLNKQTSSNVQLHIACPATKQCFKHMKQQLLKLIYYDLLFMNLHDNKQPSCLD